MFGSCASMKNACAIISRVIAGTAAAAFSMNAAAADPASPICNAVSRPIRVSER